MNWKSIIEISLNIASITGLVLSIIFFIKSKKTKAPYYEIKDFNIISDKIDKKIKDIEILYKGKRINSVTVSKIAIWNAGNETIHEKDIPDTNKFKIIIENPHEIYEYEILSKTDEDSTVKLIAKENYIEINFDYIEQNQGLLIKIIHSGNNSKCLKITGKVIGHNKIKKNMNEILNNRSHEEKINLRGRAKSFDLTEKYAPFTIGTAVTIWAIYTETIAAKIIILIFGIYFLIEGIRSIVKKEVPFEIRRKLEEE